MLTKKDIEVLRNFKFKTALHPVVSVYLNTDGKTNSKKEVDTHLKELTRLARIRIEKDPHKDSRRLSLHEIQRVEDYLIREFKEFNCRGMALFGCSSEDLWVEIELPRPPRDRFIVADVPYIRPLQFQEVEYHRYCTVLIDKNNARIFLIYQGTILEYKEIAGKAPAKVRRAGWGGYDETRTSRKLDQKITEHFHNVAATLFELYKRDHFEWLILGGRTEYLKELQSALHPYLRDRVEATLDLSVDMPEKEVLERSMKVEHNFVFKEQCRQIGHLQEVIQSHGTAVTGLEETMRHLNAQAVETLFVSRDFQFQGVRCAQCGFLGILEEKCPLCNLGMVDSLDIVTDAIDRALDLGCDVRQVYEGVGLEKQGNIGALLRFRV